MKLGTVRGNHHVGMWDLELHWHPWSATGTPQHLLTALILAWINSRCSPATHPKGRNMQESLAWIIIPALRILHPLGPPRRFHGIFSPSNQNKLLLITPGVPFSMVIPSSGCFASSFHDFSSCQLLPTSFLWQFRIFQHLPSHLLSHIHELPKICFSNTPFLHHFLL